MHTCIGEGNDNPLQYSCLEILRDRGAWWAAVYGVAQSRTRLKRLSSSSSTFPHSYVTVLGMCACSVVSDSLSPVDYSLPGSSVRGIFQALEWVTISFSRGVFPTQGSNPCPCVFPIGRQILCYCAT